MPSSGARSAALVCAGRLRACRHHHCMPAARRSSSLRPGAGERGGGGARRASDGVGRAARGGGRQASGACARGVCASETLPLPGRLPALPRSGEPAGAAHRAAGGPLCGFRGPAGRRCRRGGAGERRQAGASALSRSPPPLPPSPPRGSRARSGRAAHRRRGHRRRARARQARACAPGAPRPRPSSRRRLRQATQRAAAHATTAAGAGDARRCARAVGCCCGRPRRRAAPARPGQANARTLRRPTASGDAHLGSLCVCSPPRATTQRERRS